jgi:hypothetical protein
MKRKMNAVWQCGAQNGTGPDAMKRKIVINQAVHVWTAHWGTLDIVKRRMVTDWIA